MYVGANPLSQIDPNGLVRKPGKTPPKSWPTPPPNACGDNPNWNPEGYWEGKGRDITWDDRSHGAGVDRGQGPQGGHWDDENSGNRWDENGNLLPGSPDLKSKFITPNTQVWTPPWWILVPLFVPFPGNPIYGGL
jgi:hypothetical protein